MVDTNHPLAVVSGGAGSEEDAHKHTGNNSVVIKSCIRDLTINNVSFVYLLDVSVKLEYLSFPLHLSDTDLAGELGTTRLPLSRLKVQCNGR